jgi:hypothetical protein
VSRRDGDNRLASGEVYLDGAQLGAGLLTVTNGQGLVRTVILHELGHLVGLAHTGNPADVMYPSTDAAVDYSADDLRGLAMAGDGPCFGSA